MSLVRRSLVIVDGETTSNALPRHDIAFIEQATIFAPEGSDAYEVEIASDKDLTDWHPFHEASLSQIPFVFQIPPCWGIRVSTSEATTEDAVFTFLGREFRS